MLLSRKKNLTGGSVLRLVGQTEILWQEMNVLPHDIALNFIVGDNTDCSRLFFFSFEPHMVLKKHNFRRSNL